MAGHGDSEDYFDDDDLDALPDSELIELENNAIQYTQAQTQAARGKVAAPSSDYGDEFDDEDFDKEIVIDESRSTPAVIAPFQRNIPGQATQQEQFRAQRYGTINSSNSITQLANRQRPTPPRFIETANNCGPPAAIPLHDSVIAEQGSQASASTDIKVESLQKQLQEIIKERNALKNELNAKAGEISIVRSKQDKAAKEYERELGYLRKQNEETLAKQRKDLEAARIAEKAAVTERDFINRDLAEESERVRRLNKAREAEKKDGTVSTPKKKKAPYRDGFDDDEVELISPSKVSPSRFQRRLLGSPSKPGKRKRKIVESPAGALEVVQTDAIQVVEPKPLALDDNFLAKVSIQDGRFDFIGAMLDHRIDPNHLRTLEELGKYAFPSAPKDSFQSLILGKIPTIGLKKDTKDMSVDFCGFLLSLWKQCMEEKYVDPVYLLVDILTFALEMHTSAIAPHVTDLLVDVVQQTVDAVSIPRYKSSIEQEAYAKDIDSTPIMRLLYITAQGCMSDPLNIQRFWRVMPWKFGLVMLSTNQPEEDYLTMHKLYSTSVMKESFGAICTDDEQTLQVKLIVERLLYHLNAVLYIPKTNIKMDHDQRYRLRLQVLQLLTSMTRSPIASKAMATHRDAIGGLVNFASDQLDNLYDYKSNSEQSAKLISLAMRLLYHLVTKYEDIDMQRKLAAIPGGSQKYLLCLSRLHFSEDNLLLESGIDPDVPACALEMLEMFVSPEEGDAIHDAFSAA